MRDLGYKLKKYFDEEEVIILAFFFGSVAKEIEGEDSDLDIGVYLKDKKADDQIWRKISGITEREIDLTVLNDAAPTLVSNIFKTGVPVVIKDKKVYWDLYLEKTGEAEDFHQFVEDYWKIYSGSKSLIPEEKVRLIERIQFLKSEYEEIEEFKNLTFQEYREEKGKRRNIERWTENIMNASIDIAKIVLASEKKEMPKTYEQALFNFGLFTGLEEKEADELAIFARLENILAHEYLNVTYDKIRQFIIKSPPLYERIFEFLSKYL
jgi:uncharacterized protein YutE (UPF0331/DUF86 family)/predicted nucleotidyltransferase